MRMNRTALRITASLTALMALGLWSTGCEKRSDSHTHAHGEAGHDDAGHGETHAHDHGESGAAGSGMSDEGHGATVELGEQTAGEFQVKAARDGDVKAGAELPVDIWITGGPKVAAVRFWVGTEDAKGSMKAKAELEKDNWHTHGEVPAPMPEGAKLWIEIEAEGGLKTVVAFDLKS